MVSIHEETICKALFLEKFRGKKANCLLVARLQTKTISFFVFSNYQHRCANRLIDWHCVTISVVCTQQNNMEQAFLHSLSNQDVTQPLQNLISTSSFEETKVGKPQA